MTSRERVETNIIRKIVDHYSFQANDIQLLKSQIETQLTTTYRQVIAQQLRLYGCQKIATGPDAISLKWIQDKATKDATSIAATYLRELQHEVQRIYSKNKRSNRYAYMRALDVWSAKRDAYKINQIGLNTAIQARDYAAQRFRDENGIEGRFLFAGPPPVCKKCMRLKAKGLVSAAEAKRYGSQQHINCPHAWQAVTLGKVDCETVWTG